MLSKIRIPLSLCRLIDFKRNEWEVEKPAVWFERPHDAARMDEAKPLRPGWTYGPEAASPGLDRNGASRCSASAIKSVGWRSHTRTG